MLASPSDVDEERQIAREIILDWNNIHSSTRKIVLLPLSWDYNSIPTIGDRPQGIVNTQVLRNADILVGIFWTRIGTPTGNAISGTVEEIEEHVKLRKSTMLYFSNKLVIPSRIDHEQYNAVKNLKTEYQAKGLTEDFDSLSDFRLKFQRHLSMKLNEKEYQSITNEVPESDPDFNPTETRHSLSYDAKILLKEASKDAAGEIVKVGFVGGGFTIQTNGQQLNKDYSPRTTAKWLAAMDELLNYDLITSAGYEAEIFHITDKGYRVADELN